MTKVKFEIKSANASLMSSQDERLLKLLLMLGILQMAIQNNCVLQRLRQNLICSLHSNQQHKHSSLHYNHSLQIPLKQLQIWICEIIYYVICVCKKTKTNRSKNKIVKNLWMLKQFELEQFFFVVDFRPNAQWPEMKVHCFVRKDALYENPFVSEFCNITPSAPPLPVDFGRQR